MLPVQHVHDRMPDYGNRPELQSEEDNPDEFIGHAGGSIVKSRFVDLSYLPNVHGAMSARRGD